MLLLISSLLLLACNGAEQWQLKNVATRRHLVAQCGQLATEETEDELDIGWTATWKENYNEHSVYQIRHSTSNLCLDSNANKDTRFDRDNVVTAFAHNCNGGSFQRWLVIRLNDSRIKLRNLATMFYLQHSWFKTGAVYATLEEAATFQEWYLKNLTTPFFVEVDNTPLVCDPGPDQQIGYDTSEIVFHARQSWSGRGPTDFLVLWSVISTPYTPNPPPFALANPTFLRQRINATGLQSGTYLFLLYVSDLHSQMPCVLNITILPQDAI